MDLNLEQKQEKTKDLIRKISKGVSLEIEGKFIKWVDGMPVPVCRQIINKTSIKKLAESVLSIPYILDIADEDLEGLPVAEVMLIRLAQRAAGGDVEALNILLDRVIGKPKQYSESVTMKVSYQEFLEQIAKKEQEPPIDVSKVDSHTAEDL